MKYFLLIYCAFNSNVLQLFAQQPDEKKLLKAISNRDGQKAAGYYGKLLAIFDSADAEFEEKPA